jgi:hypothetical protein
MSDSDVGQTGPFWAFSWARRAEEWLWTGPIGHFLGGALDFTEALVRYLLMRHGPKRGA